MRGQVYLPVYNPRQLLRGHRKGDPTLWRARVPMAHFSQSGEEGMSHLHSDGNSACQSYHKSSGKSQKSKALLHKCTSHYHMRWTVPSLRAELCL